MTTPMRFIVFAFLLLSCSPTDGVLAQTVTPRIATDIADSATAARSFYRAAREQLGRADTSAALASLLSAAQAFPAQHAYAGALWAVAIKAKDATMATRAMRLANDAGIALSGALEAVETMPTMVRPPANLLARQRELIQPINASTAFGTISDKRLFPEGLAHDPRSGTMYVSGLQQRGILSVARNGDQRMLTPELPPNIGGLFGIAVDTARNLIWASSAQSPGTEAWSVSDSSLSALVAFDIATGAIRKRYALRGTSLDPSPGDLLLAANGDVFVGDGQAGVVWWLDARSDSVKMLQHKLYRSPQGMALSDDATSLFIADYSHGLLRTELATGATVRVADLKGMSTVGIDGLVRHGNQFVAVQNAAEPAQVLQFSLDASGTRIAAARVIDRSAIAISPTGGVLVGNEFVYVANTLWDRVGPTGRLAEEDGREVVLLRVRVGN